MTEIFSSTISSPFGAVVLRVQNDALVSVDFVYDAKATHEDSHPLLHALTTQLKKYFQSAGELHAPLHLQGTPFQRRVWTALQDIPVGEVRTYGQLAKQLGSSARAVGGACRANPVPLFVPCHRVVAASGLGGFSGHTAGVELATKQWLLRHEGAM